MFGIHFIVVFHLQSDNYEDDFEEEESSGSAYSIADGAPEVDELQAMKMEVGLSEGSMMTELIEAMEHENNLVLIQIVHTTQYKRLWSVDYHK